MAQNWQDIPSSETLENSRSRILDRDTAVKSCFAGTAFPTTNLEVGMACYRTDQEKLYELRSVAPDTWVMIADLTKTPLFTADVGTAAYANTGSGAANVPTISIADARYALLAGAVFTGLLRGNAGITGGNFGGAGGKLTLLGTDGGNETTTGALLDITNANLLRLLGGLTAAGVQVYSRGPTGTLDLGTNNLSRLLIGANGDTTHKTGKLSAASDDLTVKSTFYLAALSATQPQIVFDTNDYVVYDRTANAFDIVVGGAVKARITATGMAVGGTSLTQALEVTGNILGSRLLMPAGSVGSPSLAVSTNLTTGIYSPGTNQLAVAINGVLALLIDASRNPNVKGSLYAGDDALTTDGQFYMGSQSATQPKINFDANDYLAYDRTNNKLQMIVGGVSKLEVDANGVTSGGNPIAGGWTLIESRVIDSATEEIFQNINYRDLLIECVDVNKTGSGLSTISIQISSDNGATWRNAATTYRAIKLYENYISAGNLMTEGDLSYLPAGYTASADNQNCVCEIKGFGIAGAKTWDTIAWAGAAHPTLGSQPTGIGKGLIGFFTACNAIRVFPTGNSWDNSGNGWGTIKVYGRN